MYNLDATPSKRNQKGSAMLPLRPGLLLFGISFLLLAGPARTAPPAAPLARVPAGTPLVIHLRGLGPARQRLAVLLKNTFPAAEARKLIERADELLEEARLTAVKGGAADASLLLAVPGLDQAAFARAALIVPVVNHREFRDSLLDSRERRALRAGAGHETVAVEGVPVCFVPCGGFSVVTLDEKVARDYTRPRAGLDSHLGTELAKPLLAADVGVYVDLAAVKKAFTEPLRYLRQSVNGYWHARREGKIKGLEKLAPFQVIEEGLLDLLEASEHLLVTADLHPDGLALHVRLGVGARKAAAVLRAQKPGQTDDLAALPAGYQHYWAVAVDQGLAGRLLPMLTLSGVNLRDTADPLARALQRKIASRPRLQLWATRNSNAEGLEVWWCADPGAAVEGPRALYRAMPPGTMLFNGLIRATPAVGGVKRIRQGFAIHEVRIPWDHERTAEGIFGDREMARTLRGILGREQRRWFGQDEHRYVEVTASDWLDARGVLDDYRRGRKSIGQDQGFAAVRKRLPAGANLVTVHETMALVGEPAAQMFLVRQKRAGKLTEMDLWKLTGLDARTMTYTGTATVLRPGQVHFQLWMPAAALYQFQKVVTFVARLWAQG